MRKSSWFYKLALFALIATACNVGCKKTSSTDNDNSVETPMSLYFTDTAGALYNSTDGKSVTKILFTPDGVPSRSLVVSGPNILWAKQRDFAVGAPGTFNSYLYVSTNAGGNFNHSFDSLWYVPDTACNGLVLNTNQSMMVNLPKWDNRVYTLSDAVTVGSPVNYLGLVHSDAYGIRGSWATNGDGYDTFGVGVLPARMESLTMLANGILCGIAVTPPASTPSVTWDSTHYRNFYKIGKDEGVYANRWKECTANPLSISYIWLNNGSSRPLPPNNLSGPERGRFILGHLNNQLIAVDALCHHGGWYSNDTGHNWQPYAGLPTDAPALCIESPFEQICLVGTGGKGLYTLNLHTSRFEQNNNGLGTNLIVRGIAGKEVYLKNGSVLRYIYISTNQGLYQSTDGGINWTKTINGNFVTVY